ncbi:Set3 complex subunit [Ascosphaera acerosa]|nr:Set3 complex subunit [Ascosphaera acerosa]
MPGRSSRSPSVSALSDSHQQQQQPPPASGASRREAARRLGHTADLSTSHAASPARQMPKRRRDQNGRTPLARACAAQEFQAAKAYYHEVPDDLNIPDNAGNTPLQIASLEGCADIVEFLIGCGCEVETKNIDKDTPLIDAVENGHLDVVKLLLDAGANPRAGNAQGDEPYDLVPIDSDNYDEIRRVIAEAKAKSRRRKSVDERGGTGGARGASGSADSVKGSPQPASALLAADGPSTSNGASAGNRHVRSPAPHFAASNGSNASRRRTVRSETTRNDLLWTQLTFEGLRDFAAKGDLEGTASILEVLQKADTESLIAAAKGGHDEVLGLLLGIGEPDPDPDPVPGHREGFNTPMLAAIGRGNEQVIRLLLDQRGFNPTRRIFRGYAYHELAEQRKGDQWEAEYDLLKKAYDEYVPPSPRLRRGQRESRQSAARRRGATRERRTRRRANTSDSDLEMAPSRRDRVRGPTRGSNPPASANGEDSDAVSDITMTDGSSTKHNRARSRPRERQESVQIKRRRSDSSSEEPPVVRRRRLLHGRRPSPHRSDRSDGNEATGDADSALTSDDDRIRSGHGRRLKSATTHTVDAKPESTSAKTSTPDVSPLSLPTVPSAIGRKDDGSKSDKPVAATSKLPIRPNDANTGANMDEGSQKNSASSSSLSSLTSVPSPPSWSTAKPPDASQDPRSPHPSEDSTVRPAPSSSSGTSTDKERTAKRSPHASEKGGAESDRRASMTKQLNERTARPSSDQSNGHPSDGTRRLGEDAPSRHGPEDDATKSEHDKMDIDSIPAVTSDDANEAADRVSGRPLADGTKNQPYAEEDDAVTDDTTADATRAAAEAERIALQERARRLRMEAEEAERAAQRAMQAIRDREQHDLRRRREAEQRRAQRGEDERRRAAERERARVAAEQRAQDELERKRRERLPSILRAAAEFVSTNDPRAKDHRFLRHFNPIFYVTTAMLDQQGPGPVGVAMGYGEHNDEDLWIPNFLVAPLLATSDLGLSQYTAWERRAATPAQRQSLWRVCRRCMIKQGDVNPLTLTASAVFSQVAATRELFLAMEHIFWVRLLDFKNLVPHILHLQGLPLTFVLMHLGDGPATPDAIAAPVANGAAVGPAHARAASESTPGPAPVPVPASAPGPTPGRAAEGAQLQRLVQIPML